MVRSLLACSFFVLGAAFVPTIGAAEPPVRLEILATDPAGDTELAPRASLYLRVRYDADIPFRVQARGYRGGVEQQAAMMNPSPVYAAGQGEAIAWLAFETGLVDELRVLAFDERWRPVSEARVMRSVLWSRTAPTLTERAPWVASLNAEQQGEITRRAREAASRVDAGDVVLFQLVGLSVPGYFLLQGFALWRRRGRKKLAELVPLFVMVPALAHALFALAAGSNLWPIFLLFLCPPAFVYLVVVLIVRRVQRPTMVNMDSG